MKKKTPALMFQGTCSHAGKSLLTMAWCRVLSDLGYKVTPFKAQNMSLNSGITEDGGEIGRAQILQAAAARVKPETAMNPVLMKPNSENGSQIIVRGKPWQNMNARNYYASRSYLQKEIFAAYDDLTSRFDVIVLEGAGSPGEVNLKKNDMVNMAMARYAESPVILVGDIDRGGTYASFIGHFTIMDQWERDLLAGYIVNKFRGDATLLEEAHTYMNEHTGKEVLGIMPYIHQHNLPEEDGFDFETRYGNKPESSEGINVGIIALPHISNSTDIDPLSSLKRINLIQVKDRNDIYKNKIHLIIIPGSKNVFSDLTWLRQTGIDEIIVKGYQEKSFFILGICGGFQMLGKSINDPYGIESHKGNKIPGLGLLNMETIIEKEKSLKQTETILLKGNYPVTGYEIHHGYSCYPSEKEMFSSPGLGIQENRVWGTYLHGILDNHLFVSDLLKKMTQTTGLSFIQPEEMTSSLDQSIDDFTDVFRESVDIDFLLKLSGLK